jgi:hypothetical protein
MGEVISLDDFRAVKLAKKWEEEQKKVSSTRILFGKKYTPAPPIHTLEEDT